MAGKDLIRYDLLVQDALKGVVRKVLIDAKDGRTHKPQISRDSIGAARHHGNQIAQPGRDSADGSQIVHP